MNLTLESFRTSDDLLLPGMLYKGRQRTKKVLIWLHGCGSSSVFYATKRMNIFGEHLTNSGIDFFPFNNRGAHIIKNFTKVNYEESRVKYGTAFEKIEEAVIDIEAAIEFLRHKGYEEFYLAGHSTGANKICVFNHLRPENFVSRYILLGGGDDVGSLFREFGPKKFRKILNMCREAISKGGEEDLIPYSLINEIYSYRSFFDTMNPDGYYNIFPYYEEFSGKKFSSKELFVEVSGINKQSLFIYGEKDEYSYPDSKAVIKMMKRKFPEKSNFSYILLKNADHSFKDKEGSLVEAILKWLSKQRADL